MNDRTPNLFDCCAARARDPLTSSLAERQITQDGARAAACAHALAMVTQTQGLTANEYEVAAGVADGHFRKRLNDLAQQGLVVAKAPRVSAVTGKLNQTWWLVDRGLNLTSAGLAAIKGR